MSYSLQLKDGDLNATGSVLGLVQGTDKLKQDIDLWLRETYQADRFHLDYGSVLQNYIGNVIGLQLQHDIEAEVYRVMTNYQNLQIKRLKDRPTKFSPDELLRTVVGVKSVASYDSIYVQVIYESASGQVQSTQLGISL